MEGGAGGGGVEAGAVGACVQPPTKNRGPIGPVAATAATSAAAENTGPASIDPRYALDISLVPFTVVP